MTLRKVSKLGLRTGKCFIKAFTRQTCISRDLCHTFGASDIAKSFGNKCGIPVSFFKASFKISSHFLRCSEVFGDVVACSNGFFHRGCSGRLRARRKAILMSLAWVLLFPPASRNNQFLPVLLEIHPVTGTVIDSQLRDTFTNRLHVSRISSSERSILTRTCALAWISCRPLRAIAQLFIVSCYENSRQGSWRDQMPASADCLP